MTPRLVIRADATPAIGAGHLLRCVALAHAWQRRGGEVRFVATCSESLAPRIAPFGDRIAPGADDLETLIGAIRPGDAVVIDGYEFGVEYHRAVRERAIVLVIDDIAHQTRYEADLLLNQNIAANAAQYANKTDAELLLGLRYAMLRPEFTTQAFARSEGTGRVRVLVTMGGGDVLDATRAVIDALAEVRNAHVEVRVIAAADERTQTALRASAEHLACPVAILGPTDRMPQLMAESDLAICAGGTTCWELASLGVPTMVAILAENQRDNAVHLERAGAGVCLGEPTAWDRAVVAQAIEECARDVERRAAMGARGRALVDGMGAARVAEALARRCAGGS